jgi:8-oxo-dGTP diphosphatase
MTINKFNIRVYGLIVNEKNEILLSDEFALNAKMTKFPGGGMHFGEGPADCIRREAIEEFGQEIEIVEHFYTTDFFQPALFYSDMQLISIYYFVRFTSSIKFKISEKPFDFEENMNGSISFRWKSIKSLKIEDLTFPIDRHVAGLLKERS